MDYSKNEVKKKKLSWKYFISYNVAAFVVVFAIAVAVAIVLSLLSVFNSSVVLTRSCAYTSTYNIFQMLMPRFYLNVEGGFKHSYFEKPSRYFICCDPCKEPWIYTLFSSLRIPGFLVFYYHRELEDQEDAFFLLQFQHLINGYFKIPVNCRNMEFTTIVRRINNSTAERMPVFYSPSHP